MNQSGNGSVNGLSGSPGIVRSLSGQSPEFIQVPVIEFVGQCLVQQCLNSLVPASRFLGCEVEYFTHVNCSVKLWARYPPSDYPPV